MPDSLPIVAALYVRRDSVYKSIPGVDVWDIDRDAEKYNGPYPVVAHPPCRLWGKLAGLSTADEREMRLAIHSVECMLRFGGVLEHPINSNLISWVRLIGQVKLQEVRQFDFGHQAEKRTIIMVTGSNARDWPEMPLRLMPISKVVNTTKRDGRQEVPRAWRERTPKALAEWMVAVARLSNIGVAYV